MPENYKFGASCKNRQFRCELIFKNLDNIIISFSNQQSFCFQETKNVRFAFYDTSRNLVPGWPLRNLMCLLFWHCPKYSFYEEIKVVSVRGQNFHNALVFTLKTKHYDDWEVVRKSIFEGRLVGWVPNDNGKMGPNISDLSDNMDPTKYALYST